MSRTFAVSPVDLATEPLPETTGLDAIQGFIGTTAEACSSGAGGATEACGDRLVAGCRSHPLIAALHGAFASHRPVCLSPDIIWLTLTQGLAQHINANAEALRQKLVQHDGQVKIVVQRDDFQKGSPANPWPEVFSKFSAAIKGHIGAAHALVVADFSTTGPVERAASEVVLLDAMQAYFSYEVMTLCGIPSITLEGTVADWQAIRERVRKWSEFGLSFWTAALDPILAQFVAAAGGDVQREFWESIYKWEGPEGSGSPHVTGWIIDLFPYLNNHRAKWKPAEAPVLRNRWLGRREPDDGPNRNEFPALPALAPFVWNYVGTPFDMEFVGGLVGVRQDRATLSLRPEIGWAVRDADAPKYKSQVLPFNDDDLESMMTFL